MFKIDIYSGKPYNEVEHGSIDIFWSDGQMRYWGWIYSLDGMKILGDFTASSVSEAEEMLGVKFTIKEGRAKR